MSWRQGIKVSKVTEDLIKQFHQCDERRREALLEVLCSAYKDATYFCPSDRVREALYEAIDR